MKRLLFVDDDAMVLAGLRRALHDMNREWNMQFASGGQAALEVLAQQPFDAVITDVSLPGMSGIELAKELGRRHPRLPVVISSGYGAPHVEMIMGPRSQVFVLPKPYDMPTLERTLRAAAAAGLAAKPAGP